MLTPSVEFATPGDAGTIVELVQESIPRRILPLTIFGTPKAEDYVAAQIRASNTCGNRLLLVAKLDSEVVGVTEWQLGTNEIFLNHIAISPMYRRTGIGSLLFHSIADIAHITGATRVLLDVFATNTFAFAWYKRIGFKELVTRKWCLCQTPDLLPSAHPSRGYIRNLPQAELTHAEFGVSHILLDLGDDTLEIGRYGADWFRIVGCPRCTPDLLLAFLYRLDPKRKVAAILPAAHTADTPLCTLVITSSIRMEASIATVVERISKN